MSNLYNLEPQPTAKAILKTTAGDLSIELFAKQTPLACRNFLQHCLDGYYNNTIFHRLVPGFIIQGGDPTGTGAGGISAINGGDGFENEIHSRLKFNRRGLVGMANEEKESSNESQFFFTLGATPELQGRNTLFGRIEGDTIYNLMKMADAEMAEGQDRPLYPTKITGAEILVNPFEDMVARAREAPRTKDTDEGRKDVKKRKKPAGKNVLSFGGDEGEEETPVLKKVKANPKLVATSNEEPESRDEPLPKAKNKNPPGKRRASPPPASENTSEKRSVPAAVEAADDSDSDSSSEPARSREGMSQLEKTNAEIAALKASMKRNVDTAPKAKEKPKSALEAMVPANSTRGRKRGKASDERGAIDLFKAFKRRLEDMPGENETEDVETNGNLPNAAEPTTTDAAEDEEAALCDLHFIANCQSCKSWDDHDKADGEAEVGDEGEAAWMSHRLTFAKDTLGKDLEWKRKMEEIEVIDPREKAREIKEEQRKGRDKGKGKERAGK